MESLKKDYSEVCSHDDETDINCWNCLHFIFPIGCKLNEDSNENKQEEV